MSPLTSHPEPIQSPQGGAWLPALTCRGTHCLSSFRCYGKPNCENLHILLCIRRNQMLPHGTLTRNTGNEENLQEQVSPRIQYHASKDGNDGQPEVLNGLHARILGLKKKIISFSRVFIHRLTSLLILVSQTTHYGCYKRLSAREHMDRVWVLETRQLSSPGWLGTHSADQAYPELIKIHQALIPERWD